MIEINLLPKEFKKEKPKIKIPDVTKVFLPVGAVLMGILIFIHIILGSSLMFKKRTHARLDREWNDILPEKNDVDMLKKDVKRIEQKVASIDELMVKRILWSQKLNSLSDSMIPGIWLTKLSLAGAKESGGSYLNIEGCAISTYGDETATVGRFISSLKGNKDFFKDFSQIELESMQIKTIKDIEAMNFKISCFFK